MKDLWIDKTEQLEIMETWQTKCRGSNEDEYQIYLFNAQALGWKIKSYEEWLNS